ncbi:MAG: hypothetical protein AB7E12_11220 [Burkholderiaceae bacterium]|jgi:hypothetical protein
MKAARTLRRVIAPLGLVFLAACQTAPKTDTAASSAASPGPASGQSQPATPAPAPAAPAPAAAAPAEQRQGVPVAVYVADTQKQDGWQPIEITSGILYVNPEPVLTREHLSGVQAGANAQGAGLLALELNEEGRQQVTRITARYPNKRLALVVGNTMLAAPGYSTPVTTSQLIFGVGSEQNALLAARAIAGLPEDGSADAATGGRPQ